MVARRMSAIKNGPGAALRAILRAERIPMKEKQREVLALILAGGRSSRTGRPKALLPFPGGTCLERVIDTCRGGGVSAVRLVVGCRGGLIAASVAGRSVDIVWNDRWPEGQLSSLQAGLRSLPAGTKSILACSVDYPLVTASVPASLIDAWRTEKRGGKIFIPVCGGTRGRPYLFDASLVPEYLALPEDAVGRDVIGADPDRIREVPVDEEGIAFDLDDPTDYRQMRETLRRQG